MVEIDPVLFQKKPFTVYNLVVYFRGYSILRICSAGMGNRISGSRFGWHHRTVLSGQLLKYPITVMSVLHGKTLAPLFKYLDPCLILMTIRVYMMHSFKVLTSFCTYKTLTEKRNLKMVYIYYNDVQDTDREMQCQAFLNISGTCIHTSLKCFFSCDASFSSP